MRKHARVVEELLSVNAGLGDVLKAHHEELQRTTLVDREQFPKGLHTFLRSR
jgi:hypothetical protein